MITFNATGAELVPASTDSLPVLTDTRIETFLSAWLSELKPSTRKTYAASLRDFADFVQCESIVDAVAKLFNAGKQGAKLIARAYRLDLIERRKLSSNTVSLRLACLRSLCTAAEDDELTDWRLRIKTPKVEPLRDVSGPTIDTLTEMLRAAADRGGRKGKRDVCILRLLFDLGLRRAELVSLDVEHVDLVGGRLSVLGKGRDQRQWVTMPPETCRAVAGWAAVRGDVEPDSPLFCGLANNSPRGTRINPQSVYHVIREYGKAAGCVVSPHRIRHSSVTTACTVENGDVTRVMRHSRHKDIGMVVKYNDQLEDVGGQVSTKVARELQLS